MRTRVAHAPRFAKTSCTRRTALSVNPQFTTYKPKNSVQTTGATAETPRFVYFYVRKEAVLSSQIEGTQSSLADLLLYENKEVPGVPIDDVQEVSNYVAALYHGMKRLREGFPLSLRLIREIHEVL